MTLEGLYTLKLLDYKINGYRDDPERLLALLILPEKDQYEPLRVCEGEFYEAYKDRIDKKIAKVERDFEITPIDIVKYVEAKGVCCNNFAQDRIWFVYAEGFGAMHWGLMYHPELTAEEVYEECFDEPSKNKISEVAKRYQELIKACKKYIGGYEEKQSQEKVIACQKRK